MTISASVNPGSLNIEKKKILTECVFSTALLSFTLVQYICAFAAVVLFYVFYTQPDDCTEHKVFISLNLIFCIVVSVVAILPKVQVIPTLILSICAHLFSCFYLFLYHSKGAYQLQHQDYVQSAKPVFPNAYNDHSYT